MKVELKEYRNPEYHPGAGAIKRILWHVFSKIFIHSQVLIPVGLKLFILRIFGAKIGDGVMIKPNVNIKHPWLLEIGEYSWIGEDVWIDNLVRVKIGANCCVSQGALLLTGNHNFSERTFDLMMGEVILEDGSWVGAKAIVCPGVTLRSHAVLTVNSVATKDCEAYQVYQGNPAVSVKMRTIH
jgi:putative colanic acid biosynthesis acetyltransferase WcaF